MRSQPTWTGAPTALERRAASMATRESSLLPKPPPRYVGTTRTLDGSTSSASAICPRARSLKLGRYPDEHLAALYVNECGGRLEGRLDGKRRIIGGRAGRPWAKRRAALPSRWTVMRRFPPARSARRSPPAARDGLHPTRSASLSRRTRPCCAFWPPLRPKPFSTSITNLSTPSICSASPGDALTSLASSVGGRATAP